MTISARPSLAAPVFKWKGCQGHARKPHAERSRHGEHRTGEDVGEAEPLMLMEAAKPIGKGVGQGHRPQRLPPQSVGQEPTRVASRRGLPKRSAEGFPLVTDWRDRDRSIVTKKKPRRSGVEGQRSSSSDGKG